MAKRLHDDRIPEHLLHALFSDEAHDAQDTARTARRLLLGLLIVVVGVAGILWISDAPLPWPF
jgi:hypothetical protein